MTLPRAEARALASLASCDAPDSGSSPRQAARPPLLVRSGPAAARPAGRPEALASVLLALRQHLRLAHHIPGRLRVKLDPGFFADPAAADLARSLQGLAMPRPSQLRGVVSCRVNWKSLSAVVEYDAAWIRPGLLTQLFSAPEPAAFRRALAELLEAMEF